MIEQIKVWCALNRVSGLGLKSYHHILAAFGSPDAFLSASATEVGKRLPNIAENKWRKWREVVVDTPVQLDLDWLAGADNRHILTFNDERYPPLLKEISDPPVLLYIIGDVDLLSMPQLGVVGSRQCTPGGEQICTQLCAEVSAAGVVITSGMALGIDGCAHQAALNAGGKTIAVVGTGLDIVYPARHHELAHAIAANGAIVSEFPIGTGVRQQNFPLRNRIISGLSTGVLVVEASIQSGSLITARQANEQGREVFAVPGSVFSPLSKGCHALIRQGAKLTETGLDILEELLPLAKAGTSTIMQKEQAPKTPTALSTETTNAMPKAVETSSKNSPEENKLLAVMGFDPVRVDDLVPRIELTIDKISAMLLMLELDGKVMRLPGGRYQRYTK